MHKVPLLEIENLDEGDILLPGTQIEIRFSLSNDGVGIEGVENDLSLTIRKPNGQNDGPFTGGEFTSSSGTYTYKYKAPTIYGWYYVHLKYTGSNPRTIERRFEVVRPSV